MIAKRHPRATRYLGAPAGWQPENHGDCAHLAISDTRHKSGNAMESIWEPTPAEMERLNAGAPVSLLILGEIHPPVTINVGMIPSKIDEAG
jgi:hypothetical protein